MEQFLESQRQEPYFIELMDRLDKEYESHTVYPPREDLFACFKHLKAENVRVVILGQDPYHQPRQANGLAFSVHRGVKIPPSLRNIYTEMHDDVGIEIPDHGDLSCLALQGVLLLNNVLSVVEGKPNSHQHIGWEVFVENTMQYLDTLDQPMVFLLWGNNARKKKKWITRSNHLVLESAHPSPLSAYRGFFGSKPFSKTNEFLIAHGQEPIDWRIQ